MLQYKTQDISLPFGVKGFRLSGKFITVWDEENVHIYEIKDSNDAPISITSSANFTCSAKDATVFGSMVIVLESNKLDIRTFQGTIRQTLGFREIEGLPILMDFNGKYMAVATTNGYLSVYDLSGKDIKQQFHSSQFSKTVPEFDKFLMIRVNSAGNRISFTATQV
uniref:IFT140 second beta-propeller domain-containing protein n=1 Tax=Panagrolaimus davidi TaxID=227884 RepID=A0A914QJ26_9BILA